MENNRAGALLMSLLRGASLGTLRQAGSYGGYGALCLVSRDPFAQFLTYRSLLISLK